ncbi:hypothetical protein [Actinoplanes sp. NPDC049265]|uniref:hypothetical protein n=1 Tax=Actinoplanes sp. NPDC049265 TaxID=3363902 RepID=UPI00371B58E1
MIGRQRAAATRLAAVTAALLAGSVSPAILPARAEVALPVAARSPVPDPWLDLGTLGGANAIPTGLNNRGDVVGVSPTADGTSHGFRWRDGVMTDLTPGAGSAASAINDRGDIAGSITVGDTHQHAALWRQGRLVDIGTLGGTSATATAVNARGDVIGQSSVAGHDDDSLHAFWWHDGVRTRLPGNGYRTFANDINDRGDVVGSLVRHDGADHGAALWRRGRLVTLVPTFGDPDTAVATRVNNRGQVLGSVHVPGSGWHVFVKTGRTYADLGLGVAVDLNDRGEAVFVDFSIDPSRAARWFRGVTTRLPAPGNGGTSAADIDNRGLIVGNAAGAVVWTRSGDVIDLGALVGRATMINEYGRVAGYVNTPDGNLHAVVTDIHGAPDPRLWVRPPSARPGDTVRIGGLVPFTGPKACPADAAAVLTSVSALFPPEGFGPAVERTKSGRFLVSYHVPATTPPATYQIGVRCSGGNLGVNTTLHVI